MKRKKVLHVIKSLGRGGAEVLLAETVKIHDKERYEFFCIYFLPWKYQMVQALKDGGAKVYCFEANNNLQMLMQYNKVIEFCKEKEIDIIHCHLPWSGFLGRIIHSKIKIPMIYTEHNIQEHYHPVTKKLNKISFEKQDLAIGVSADVTRSIKENIAPQIPVVTVLNGVNTQTFTRSRERGSNKKKELGIPSDALVVGTIAVFREQKAILQWVKAFNQVQMDFPEVYGIIVGAGPQKEEIEQLISELNLQDKIVMPGLQTDTISYFSAMDIYMMSSRFEGLPIALLEAMSMECAIVSTKAGGVVEVVRHETDGLLCEVADLQLLAEHVKNLVRDPGLRNRLQLSARKRVEQEFSLRSMVNQLEDIYQGTLKKKTDLVELKSY